MQVFLKSYQGALELLESSQEFSALKRFLQTLPTPVWSGKSATPGLSVVPQALNALISEYFIAHEWIAQPMVTEDTQFYADFYKFANARQLLCEVQLGNAARFDSDLIKFQIGKAENRCDVALEIVPMRNTAKRMNINTANFERAEKTLDSMKPILARAELPILLVGFDMDDEILPVDSQFPNKAYKQVSVVEKVEAALRLYAQSKASVPADK